MNDDDISLHVWDKRERFFNNGSWEMSNSCDAQLKIHHSTIPPSQASSACQFLFSSTYSSTRRDFMMYDSHFSLYSFISSFFCRCTLYCATFWGWMCVIKIQFSNKKYLFWEIFKIIVLCVLNYKNCFNFIIY